MTGNGNATETGGPAGTLGVTLRRWASERPDAEALVFKDRRTTYAALDSTADRVAQRLLRAGVGRGGRVALLAKNSDRFFEILYGAARIGAVLVPINFRLAPPEIAFIVNDARAEILFVDADHAELLGGLADGFETVREVVALEDEIGDWPAFADWCDTADALDPGIAIGPEDVAVQMYTSGTTGHPKGVETTHRNVSALEAAGSSVGPAWHGGDTSLVCMPLFHIAGAGWAFLGLSVGCRNVILPDVVPADILRLIEGEGVTKTFMVPAVIQFMLQEPGVGGRDFSRLELIEYGASPIAQDVLRRALRVFGCRFIQLYGLTETTGAVTWLPPADHDPDGGARMASCGIPWGDVELRIVGPDGTPLPVGEVGEVVCRSTQVMAGYWNRPEATADAIRDGWFHTGDAGRLDEDGYLYIQDRIKDMIISGGENIYPAEIESALFDHPAVADIAIIGVPDPTWGEAPKAVAVLVPGEQLDLLALQSFARERLAGFKVPKSLEIVDALPRNPSGKVLKRVLRERFGQTRPAAR